MNDLDIIRLFFKDRIKGDLEKVIEEFSKEYPNIVINTENRDNIRSINKRLPEKLLETSPTVPKYYRPGPKSKRRKKVYKPHPNVIIENYEELVNDAVEVDYGVEHEGDIDE